jgi:hypothetical protein
MQCMPCLPGNYNPGGAFPDFVSFLVFVYNKYCSYDIEKALSNITQSRYPCGDGWVGSGDTCGQGDRTYLALIVCQLILNFSQFMCLFLSIDILYSMHHKCKIAGPLSKTFMTVF